MSSVQVHPILVSGQWRPADCESTFQASDPSTSFPIEDQFPRSRWSDCEAVLDAATTASRRLIDTPAGSIARFLEAYADGLQSNADAICEAAVRETGLALQPRLLDIEMPRTIDQLRQAAEAARNDSWRRPVRDSERKIYSCLGPIGPVLVFGPNNFPLAYNAISGGDFAAAIAAGNPVIAKAHPDHPMTSYLLATQAQVAAEATSMPSGTVQMIYDVAPDNGLRMVADHRVAAIGFTGSRPGGLKLKAAADAAGKPIYLEMSSVNPVFLLPEALERDGIVDEVSTSCLAGGGQFCTCPNLIVVEKGDVASRFQESLIDRCKSQPTTTLLSNKVVTSLKSSLQTLTEHGASVLVGGQQAPGPAQAFENTLLTIDAERFLAHPEQLQTEAFGPSSLLVLCDDTGQMTSIAECIEGSLAASVFGDVGNVLLRTLTTILRRKAGRVLHNKMPTGVAVSPAMNHGGPFPATGHPRFTAVGIPASIERFTKLDCYDNVADEFLPQCLQDEAT